MADNRVARFQGPMNVTVENTALEAAPSAYKTFSDGSPKKFVIDPHGSVKKAHNAAALG